MTGCWGKRELNEIGIIAVTGIDLEPNGDVRMTVISLEPSGSPTAASQRSSAWIGTATGPSVVEAGRNLRAMSSRNLVWFQNEFIIIGQGMAKSGLKDVMDFFARSREIRYGSHVFIAKERAVDIMQTPADTDQNLASHLDGLLKSSNEWPGAYIASLKEILVSIEDKSKGTVTARLAYDVTTRSLFSASAQESDKLRAQSPAVGMTFLDGSAVFTNDEKLAGWLDTEENRGYMWITGKVNTLVLTSTLGGKKGAVAVQIRGVTTEIKPELIGDKIVMNVNVKAKASLAEQTVDLDIMDDPTVKSIEKAFSDIIVSEMNLCVNKAQKDLDSDIFGFGGSIFRKYPNVWRKISTNWDKIFPDIEVKCNATVILRRVGKTSSTIYSTGSAQ